MTISAPYLPIALIGVAWIVNGTWMVVTQDLLECAAGHVGWFVRDGWQADDSSDAPDALYVSCCSVGGLLSNTACSGNNFLEIFERKLMLLSRVY